MDNNVAIIGSGITGLTAAYYLKKAGVRFKVFEKSEHIGGVIQSCKTDAFLYETGPNSGVIANAEIADLFKELKDDCKFEIADHSSARRLIWKGNRWHALPSGLISAVTTPLFTLSDKFRVLGEPFRKKGNNPNETLAELVKRRLGNSFLNYAIDPFILGIYAGDPAYIVPKYALPKLYNLEQDYGSFIGGAIKKRKEVKSDNDKKATREIFSIEGGLEQLINALVKNIGNKNIATNCQNIIITRSRNDFLICSEINNPEIYSHVISTTNVNELELLFPFLPKIQLTSLQSLKYAKVTEINIGFNKWDGMPLNAFGGLVPFKENRKILGVLFMSTLFKNRAPRDGALLTIFVGGTRKPEMVELSNSDLKLAIKNELDEMMGLKSFKPDLYITTTYNKAIAQYGKDSEERYKSISSLEDEFPGLYLAGSIRNGVGIADRVKQAKDIVTMIIHKN